MVQKLVREENIRLGDSISITEAELRAGFTRNKSEYKPTFVRFSQLVRNAKQSREKICLSFLEKRKNIILREEKKGVSYAFAREAKAHSQDLQTKSSGGDLGFKAAMNSKSSTEKRSQKQFLTSSKLETPSSLRLRMLWFCLMSQRNAVVRTLEMVKPRLRINLQEKNKDFEALVEKLKKQGKVEIDATSLRNTR